jgi:hypothetical protein
MCLLVDRQSRIEKNQLPKGPYTYKSSSYLDLAPRFAVTNRGKTRKKNSCVGSNSFTCVLSDA